MSGDNPRRECRHRLGVFSTWVRYPPFFGRMRTCLRCGAVKAGSHTAILEGNHLQVTDAAAPAAPGAGLTRIYATSGKLRYRAGAAGADTDVAAQTVGQASVTTGETTTSTTYTDLATAGPAVTLSPGSARNHLIWFHAWAGINAAPGQAFMSVAIAGAAASDNDAALTLDVLKHSVSNSIYAAGVADGAPHTAKYRVSQGIGTWEYRRIVASTI